VANRVLLAQVLLWTKLTIIGFTLFALAIVKMSEIKPKKADLEKPKAEIIITMTWPDNYVEDIDLWLKQPDKRTVFYSDRESTISHLERDDRGDLTDTYKDANGVKQVYKYNYETNTIRALIPGEYIVNAIYYSANYNNSKTRDIPVTIKAEKLNPTVTEITSRTFTLHAPGSEVTAFRFTVTPDGQITDINTVQELFGTDQKVQAR
jgi:hypothetical protein